MLKASDNLTSYRLAAGEPFLLSVQVRDKSTKSVIPMAQRPLVLSFYRANTRETVAQIHGVIDTDASGEFVRFARDGSLSDSLHGQLLSVELAERFKTGRATWAVGRLEIAASAGGVETFGDLVGRTESRITVYEDGAGVQRGWEQEQVPFSADVAAPPRFTTPASISSDGTPQVGELLTGIDGAATDAVSYARRWLLGSTVMTTLRDFQPQAVGDYAYEVTATGPGGSTTSTSHISVAAATPVPQPSYSLSGAPTVMEGNSGTALLTWTLTLDRDGSSATFPFSWAVAGTGINPADAADFGGVLPTGAGAFAPGETVKTIAVPVSGDALIENDETFLLTVTAAGLGTLTSTGTIANDDVHTPAPTLSISSAITQAEGNSGTTAFTWTLTLDRDGSTAAYPFSWSTAGSGASPADAADFGGIFPSGSGTFAPGETSKTIIVLATGDVAVEPNDTFTITAAASGLNTVTSTGTITNDDVRIPAPALSLSAAVVQNEGQSGTTAFVYALTLARDGSTAAIPYSYAFIGAGANPADAADFGGTFPSGSGTFAPGETTRTITALVAGDTTVEPDEGLLLTVESPGLTTVTVGGTIKNDDAVVTTPPASGIPRVWINTDFTTDNTTDPDDQQLMYAALLFSDMYDIRGIGTNPSGATGTSGVAARDQLLSLINGSYAADHPTLVAANPAYPSAFVLAARTYAGNGARMVDATTGRPTDASTALVAEARAANAAGVPLWVLEWGPRTNLAQALLQDPSIISMIRVFNIGPRIGYNYTSDPVASDYVNARALNDGLWQIFSDTTFRGFYINSAGSNAAISGWVERYARGYGAMGAELSHLLQLRPTSPTGLKAGDGSSLFYIIDNVLRGVGDDPTQAGWGGRYVKNTALGANAWSDSQATADRLSTTYPGAKTVYDQRGTTGINGGYLAAWANRFARLTFAGVKVTLDASTGTVAEGSTLTVMATRAADHVYGNTRPFTVDYALVGFGGSPLSAADFGGTLPAGTLTFGGSAYVNGSNTVAGADTSKTITLTPASDAATEGTETGTLTLSNFDGGSIAGTIISNAITVTDASVGAPPAQTTYTADNFSTVTADGNLPGRAATGGGTWVNYRTDRIPLVKLATLDATGQTTTGLGYINVTPPTTDYEVEEDVVFTAASGASAGPIINMSGSLSGGNGTFYSFFYDFANGWTIGKDAASAGANPPNNTASAAASGIAAPTGGQTKKLKLRRVTSGGVATLTGYVDGVLALTVTDGTPINAVGFPGSRFISTCRVDNFVARSNPS